MSKLGSVTRQCRDLINGAINEIGHSKYDAEQRVIAELRTEGVPVTEHAIAQRTGIYSIETRKQVLNHWVQCANYAKENFDIRDIRDIRADHVGAWLNSKIESDLTTKTIKNMCGSMEKFGVALRRQHGDPDGRYNFSDSIQEAREEARAVLRDNPPVNRAFENPAQLAQNLRVTVHSIGADLMYQGGARISEVSELRADRNMLGIDPATGKGRIKLTNTKNGKIREILVPADLYRAVEREIAEKGVFRFDKDAFRADLRETCYKTGENADNGPHGFRYNYAQNRYQELIRQGYTAQHAKYIVSRELGHGRASITDRYLGRSA